MTSCTCARSSGSGTGCKEERGRADRSVGRAGRAPIVCYDIGPMALFSKETPPPKNNITKTEAPGPGVAFLGPNIVLDGNLTGNEDFLIEGKVKGKVSLDSDLRIGANARVDATVHARNVTIEGTLIGDVSADNRVELINGSNVEGNIKAPKIVVSEGARFRGTVDMGNERPDEEPREQREPKRKEKDSP